MQNFTSPFLVKNQFSALERAEKALGDIGTVSIVSEKRLVAFPFFLLSISLGASANP
jgi:hypothetical protein